MREVPAESESDNFSRVFCISTSYPDETESLTRTWAGSICTSECGLSVDSCNAVDRGIDAHPLTTVAMNAAISKLRNFVIGS